MRQGRSSEEDDSDRSVIRRLARVAGRFAGTGAGAGDGLRRHFVFGTGGSFVLKLVAVAVSFVCTVLIRRTLPLATYGAVFYALNFIVLLSIPAVFGMDRLLVREVAAFTARNELPLLRGVLRWTSVAGLVTSLGTAAVAAAVVCALLRAGQGNRGMLIAILVALPMLPVRTLSILRQSALRGLKHVLIAFVPDLLIPPMLVLALFGAGVLFFRDALNAETTLMMQMAGLATALAVGVFVLRWRLPTPIWQGGAEYRPGSWFRSALMLMLVSSMYTLNARTDTFLLGLFKGDASVGVYSGALGAAEFMAFIQMAVNTTLAPAAAQLYAQRDMARLQQVLRKLVRYTFGASLAAALGFIVFGHWYLLIFGKAYTAGYTALAILCVGQLISASAGSVGVILTMTGYEKDAALGSAIGVTLSILLGLALIPVWGIEGAALANAAGVAVWNIMLSVTVRRRLGLHASIIGTLVKETANEKA